MKRRIQIFDADEMNRQIERAYRYTNVIFGKHEDNDNIHRTLSDFSWFHYAIKNVTLTTAWGTNMKPTTFIFTLDGKEVPMRQGSECYAILRKCAGEYIPSLRNDKLLKSYVGFIDGKFANRQAGLLWSNPKFNKKEVYAYGYDINSAYLYPLYTIIPDTRKVKGLNRNVGKGEIGFLFDNELTMVEKGYADVIFDLIESPACLKSYCERWFEKKKQKSPEAKQQIVNAVGYMQYHNPYLRSYIICTCNNRIKSLIDKETTILCNTDAIYSTVPLDLDLGDGIGQFKSDEGYIKIDGVNYKSEVFGNKERGVVACKTYEIRNNRICRVLKD